MTCNSGVSPPLAVKMLMLVTATKKTCRPDAYFYIQGIDDPELIKELTASRSPAAMVLEAVHAADQASVPAVAGRIESHV